MKPKLTRKHRTIEQMDIDNYEGVDLKSTIEYEVPLRQRPDYVPKKFGRRKLREYTFKFLFSLDFHNATKNIEENKEKFKEEVIELAKAYSNLHEVDNQEDINHILEVTKIFVDSYEVVEKHIVDSLMEEWNITRISKVSLGLLKLGIIEMLYLNTPYKVAINEVVELSKRYQGKKETLFVNGLLGQFVKVNDIEKIQKEKRIELEKQEEEKKKLESELDAITNIEF